MDNGKPAPTQVSVTDVVGGLVTGGLAGGLAGFAFPVLVAVLTAQFPHNRSGAAALPFLVFLTVPQGVAYGGLLGAVVGAVRPKRLSASVWLAAAGLLAGSAAGMGAVGCLSGDGDSLLGTAFVTGPLGALAGLYWGFGSPPSQPMPPGA
jgi:hypothetical protein